MLGLVVPGYWIGKKVIEMATKTVRLVDLELLFVGPSEVLDALGKYMICTSCSAGSSRPMGQTSDTLKRV
jgi:hypothetical protein